MKNLHNRKLKLSFRFGILTIISLLLLSCQAEEKQIIPITSTDTFFVYLPFVKNGDVSSPNTPLNVPIIHIPYIAENDLPADAFPEMAIFWFGKVTINNNYHDVRIGYNNEALFVYTASFDRLLWYDESPGSMNLDEWDSIALYITSDNASQLSENRSFRFNAGLAPIEAVRADYQKSYRWDGNDWKSQNIPFTSVSNWRGPGLNDADDDRGWNLSFRIPFSSFGINQMPQDGTVWQLGIVAYDKDYSNSSEITSEIWPLEFENSNVLSWGKISFSLLQTATTSGTIEGSMSVREGLNGAVVSDASPGGFTICGSRLNFWTEWGEKVYLPVENYTANIQNQRDIADWPCFSKFYINFPIPEIPEGKSVIQAKLKLHLYGNAGEWGDPVFQPYRSLIQLGRTESNWTENTLNWNNAPILLENISQTWVYPEELFQGWPGVPYEWDITSALESAISQGESHLSLVLYSADGAYHSGKYFSTSEVEEWNAVARPTLILDYGNP